MQRATNTATVSANTLECALEMSKKTWLLAIQFPDREQPSVYTIKGGDAAALLAKLIAARDRWATVRHRRLYFAMRLAMTHFGWRAS
jgi:hypothetical protein